VKTVLSLKPETTVQSTLNHAKVRAGKWLVCSRDCGNLFTAVGLYFGCKVVQETGVPIGLIKSAVGGAKIEPWTSPDGWASVPELPPVGKLPAEPEYRGGYPSTPHCLYHGMIHPITRFRIKGVLWYQGESNGNEGTRYYRRTTARRIWSTAVRSTET
jgi:sialate O-acetylesterase